MRGRAPQERAGEPLAGAQHDEQQAEPEAALELRAVAADLGLDLGAQGGAQLLQPLVARLQVRPAAAHLSNGDAAGSEDPCSGSLMQYSSRNAAAVVQLACALGARGSPVLNELHQL